MTNVNLHAPEYKNAESKVITFYFVQGEGMRRCIQRQALGYVAVFRTLRLNDNINKKFALHNCTSHMGLNFKRGALQIKGENAFS